jgi:type I restriction enzyme S subunit
MSSKTKTTHTKGKVSSALVPKLRFPEFQDAGEWEAIQLGRVLKFQAGYPFPSSGFNDAGKGPRLIRNRDLRTDEMIVHYSGSFDRDYLVENGEVLIGMDGDFTPMIWSKGEALLNQRVGRILPFDSQSREFLFYMLTLCMKRIEDVTARTTVKHLSHAAVVDMHELIPTLPEQQRIASCLSSLDTLITAHTQKLSALKTYKKGLMQQLFPREGETVPRLRFPEFMDVGEWAKKKLGDVANLRNGYAFKSTEYLDSGAFKIITIANVQQGILALDSTKSIAALPSDIQLHQVLSPGDILISMTGNVGRICRVNAEGLLLNQRVGKLTPTAIDDSFFYQLLQRDEFRNTMQLKAAGGAQGNLSGGDIAEYGFTMPTEPDEQRRIADCLTTLDDFITAQTHKLETLKTHKKGMMHGLFPAAEDYR